MDLGKPYIPIKSYVAALEQHLQQLLAQEPERKISIIAHSMGGLITRMLLEQKPELATKLTKVITLGTPHKGTAAINKQADNWTSNLFHPQGPHISSLKNFAQSAPDLEVITLASEHDLIVFPVDFALLEQGQYEKLSRISHTGLLTEDVIQQKVIQYLAQECQGNNAPDTKQ